MNTDTNVLRNRGTNKKQKSCKQQQNKCWKVKQRKGTKQLYNIVEQ